MYKNLIKAKLTAILNLSIVNNVKPDKSRIANDWLKYMQSRVKYLLSNQLYLPKTHIIVDSRTKRSRKPQLIDRLCKNFIYHNGWNKEAFSPRNQRQERHFPKRWVSTTGFIWLVTLSRIFQNETSLSNFDENQSNIATNVLFYLLLISVCFVEMINTIMLI